MGTVYYIVTIMFSFKRKMKKFLNILIFIYIFLFAFVFEYLFISLSLSIPNQKTIEKVGFSLCSWRFSSIPQIEYYWEEIIMVHLSQV